MKMILIFRKGISKVDDTEYEIHRADLVLSNGAEYTVRERQDTSGYLDIEVDGTLVIIPKASNTIRLRIER